MQPINHLTIQTKQLTRPNNQPNYWPESTYQPRKWSKPSKQLIKEDQPASQLSIQLTIWPAKPTDQNQLTIQESDQSQATN